MSISVTDRIKRLQGQLNLDQDGIIGPATLTALERVVAGANDENAHEGFSVIASRSGIGALIRFEISTPAYYRRNLTHPVWPGGNSGITIGIGYDAGYSSVAQIRRDWRGVIPDRKLDLITGVAGLKGKAARAALWRVRNVSISLEQARTVFYRSTLPVYAQKTRRAYAGIEKLPADAQSMLLSLVYNRGARMSGSRRREMKNIKPLVKKGDLDGIAAEVRSMTRLWDASELPGLHNRRQEEATTISKSLRPYDWQELIFI